MSVTISFIKKAETEVVPKKALVELQPGWSSMSTPHQEGQLFVFYQTSKSETKLEDAQLYLQIQAF